MSKAQTPNQRPPSKVGTDEHFLRAAGGHDDRSRRRVAWRGPSGRHAVSGTARAAPHVVSLAAVLRPTRRSSRGQGRLNVS